MADWRERMAEIEAARENNWARQLREQLDAALSAVLDPEQASGELNDEGDRRTARRPRCRRRAAEGVVTVADFPLTWPPVDTHAVNPPADHYYASALWLCGRHPQLVHLVERVPDVITHDDDGTDWFELDTLADALDALDAYLLAWRNYRASTYEPRDEDKWQAWEDAGPRTTNAGALAIAPMSRTEVSRLRLLAFFAPSSGAGRRMTVGDLGGFDDAGRRLLHDWTLALLTA